MPTSHKNRYKNCWLLMIYDGDLFKIEEVDDQLYLEFRDGEQFEEFMVFNNYTTPEFIRENYVVLKLSNPEI